MSRSQPRVRLAAGLAVVAGAVACAELAVTNPFDPNYEMTVTISGPDTATSLNQDVQMSASWSPDWPNAPVAWSAGDINPDVNNLLWPSVIKSEGAGRYRVTGFAGVAATILVRAQVGPHLGTRMLVLRQRMRRIGWIPCTGSCDIDLSSGGRYLSAWMYDSLGSKLWDGSEVPADLAASVMSRDTSVVTVSDSTARDGPIAIFTLIAHAPGVTYIVSPKYATDSVLVHVQ